MRQAIAHQPRAYRLQHQTRAGVGLFEALQRSAIHNAWIDMRKQTGAGNDQLAHRGGIIQCSLETLPLQKLSRFRKNTFWLISQAEQRLFTTGCSALLAYSENLVGSHEMRSRLARVFTK